MGRDPSRMHARARARAALFDARASAAAEAQAIEGTVMKPEIRKLIKEIEANGFPCEQGRTHIRVLNRRRTGMIASLPLTPSRGRYLMNLRADLRRKGVL